MNCILQFVVIFKVWSLVSHTSLALEELVVPNCENQTKECGEGEDRENWANITLCSCKKDCDLFGDCCRDRGLSNLRMKTVDLEEEEVFGIPRKYWGCQHIKTLYNKKVRMVTKCPHDTNTVMSEKCEASKESATKHYTMYLPVLNTHGVWYQNIYCAICHGDGNNLVQLKNYVNCSKNITKQEILQVINEGTYTDQGNWVLRTDETKTTCSIETDDKDFNGTQFLHYCGIIVFTKIIVPIESCPADWEDHDFAQKCQAYTLYTKKINNDSLLTQVFKNPHCAVCNGMAVKEIRCPMLLGGISNRKGMTPSLNIIMDFMDFDQGHASASNCELPMRLWDPLHNECIQLIYPDEKLTQTGNTSIPPHKCHTISLKESEYERLENGSIKFVGKDSFYTGHLFNNFDILENGTAVICAPNDTEARNFISGTPQEYLTAFCLSISVICLILHVATYCVLPKLCNLPGKNLLSLSWALLFAQLILLVGVSPEFEIPDAVCVGIAVVEHYCFLAAFFWMNVMSVDIWRTFSVSKIRGTGGIKTHRKYAGYAWGSSGLICLAALTVDVSTDSGTVKPFFGKNQLCWFGNGGGLGLFLALPMFLLLVVNMCLFVITVRKIWLARWQGASYIRDKTKAELLQTSIRNSSNGKSQNTLASISGRKDQVRFYLYVKLFTIMGLTWLFGFVATFTGVSFLWYPFIIFNGLQGAFIFIMFDIKRNIAFMLWDKYMSKHGYTPPDFIARPTRSTIKMSSSGRSNSTTMSARSSTGAPEKSRTFTSTHSTLSSTVT